MDYNDLNKPLRWYQRFSGVMLVGILVAVTFFALFVAGTIGYYYWQIKKGNGQMIFNKIQGGFTADVKNNSVVKGVNRAELEISNAPFLGSSNPKVTIVEFVDFKCPNCKNEASILRSVVQKYGNKVKLIIRNFPVESTHPGATQLANIATCAYQLGYYWPVHDWLYEEQGNLGSVLNNEEISALAVVFGWEAEKMAACLADLNTRVLVNKDFADGYRFGVAGTPTFFVNGEKVEGVVSLKSWELFLDNVK